MFLFRHLDIVDTKEMPVKLTIASGPVIIKDNKVLLDKHDDPFWKFPGGSVQDDDSFQSTAIREAKEELGIEIELDGEPFVVAFDREYNGVKEYVVLIHYLARPTTLDINPGQEVTAYEWFDIKNLPKDIAPNVSAVMKHYVK